MTTLPTVAVLMATFNGGPWIERQVISVLEQDGVRTRLVISDDGSSDDTLEILGSLAERYPDRVHVLPSITPTGRASQNFFRLVRDASVSAQEYVAFADQDDEWLAGKLDYQVQQLTRRHADGTSSSVLAFDSEGHTQLIKKDWPEARFDYLFQSPGPGSTHLLTPRAFALIRSVAQQQDLSPVEYHDWLDYALVRARGWSWYVSPETLVRYRQHGTNAMGANIGRRAKFDRIQMLRRRWYRQQVLTISQMATTVIPTRETLTEVEQISYLVGHDNWRSRITLARRASQFRRSPRDKMILRALILLGIW